MMNKAFIFDWDGVLIDSESAWGELEREAWPQLFGKDVAKKMPDLIGAGLQGVLDEAEARGATFKRADIVAAYEDIARRVYKRSRVTSGVEVLVRALRERGFKLGIVSQSSRSWLDNALRRLPFLDAISTIVTLPDRPELKLKPAPDGFLAAFIELGAAPHRSIVLEDSNLGIAAAKASGAFVIAYRGNLTDGYEQNGADVYADTMNEVRRIVQSDISL